MDPPERSLEEVAGATTIDSSRSENLCINVTQSFHDFSCSLPRVLNSTQTHITMLITTTAPHSPSYRSHLRQHHSTLFPPLENQPLQPSKTEDMSPKVPFVSSQMLPDLLSIYRIICSNSKVQPFQYFCSLYLQSGYVSSQCCLANLCAKEEPCYSICPEVYPLGKSFLYVAAPDRSPIINIENQNFLWLFPILKRMGLLQSLRDCLYRVFTIVCLLNHSRSDRDFQSPLSNCELHGLHQTEMWPWGRR